MKNPCNVHFPYAPMTAPAVRSDPFTLALKQVSKESGVPWERFVYCTDRNGTMYGELNRRAYAIMAMKANVVPLSCLVPDNMKEDYTKHLRGTRREAPELRAIYDVMRNEGTPMRLVDIATKVGKLPTNVSKALNRLRQAGIVISDYDSSEARPQYSITKVPFETALVILRSQRNKE